MSQAREEASGHCTILYNTLQYYTILYNTIQYYIIPYNTILDAPGHMNALSGSPRGQQGTYTRYIQAIRTFSQGQHSADKDQENRVGSEFIMEQSRAEQSRAEPA